MAIRIGVAPSLQEISLARESGQMNAEQVQDALGRLAERIQEPWWRIMLGELFPSLFPKCSC